MKYLLFTLLILISVSCKKTTEVEDTCTDLSERPPGDDTNYVRIIGLMPYPPDGEYEKILFKDFRDVESSEYAFYYLKFYKNPSQKLQVIDMLPSDEDFIKCVQPWYITNYQTGSQFRDILDNNSDSLLLLNPNGWINQKVKYENAKQGEWIFF